MVLEEQLEKRETYMQGVEVLVEEEVSLEPGDESVH